MARPSTIADLADYMQQGDDLGTLYIAEVADDPALLKVASSYIEAMRKAGHVVTREYNGRVAFHRALDLEVAADRIRDAQREWDKHEVEHEMVTEFGGHPDDRWGYRAWCQKEGKEMPEHVEALFA